LYSRRRYLTDTSFRRSIQYLVDLRRVPEDEEHVRRSWYLAHITSQHRKSVGCRASSRLICARVKSKRRSDAHDFTCTDRGSMQIYSKITFNKLGTSRTQPPNTKHDAISWLRSAWWHHLPGDIYHQREAWERRNFLFYLILKRLYVHRTWTLNYIANVHDRIGNVHDFVILFRAMSAATLHI